MPPFDQYQSSIRDAREAFASANGIRALIGTDTDPLVLELDLIFFSAIGVRMTEPVEGWIRRAGERCEALGLGAVAKALYLHSKAEAGHHLMMIRDANALVLRWNSRHAPALDCEKIMAETPSPGAENYIKVHEENIAGPTPYAQVAIEYEIEMLPLRYGRDLIGRCEEKLGKDIFVCLSFVTEHVELDVGHTHFNERQLKELVGENPERVRPMVASGSAALSAYGEFLQDCLGHATAFAEKSEARLR